MAQRKANRAGGGGRVGRGGQFTAPPPKGVRLAAPIPKSVPYEAPEPDENEEAAFAGLQDTGRPQRNARRGRANGQAGPALSPAQLRMRGASPAQGDNMDDDDTEGNEYDDDVDEEADRVADPPLLPPLQPAMPQRTSHPISPFTGPATPTATQAAPLGSIFSDVVVGLHCRVISPEDVDHLWDWVRGDKDYGYAFIGRTFHNSLALHEFMQKMAEAEGHGIAMIRSVQYYEHHLGFVLLAPILAEEKTALLHVYLQPAVRSQLAQFAGPLVEIAMKTIPGVHLAVSSTDDAMTRTYRSILKPLRFVEHTMFVL